MRHTKFVVWLAVGLAVYLLVTQPVSAADATQQTVGFLQQAGDAFSTFVTNLSEGQG